MLKDNAAWVGIGALIIVLLIAFLISLRVGRGAVAPDGGPRRGRHRPHRNDFRPEGSLPDAPPKKRAAIIVNPTKFANVSAVEHQITEGCLEHGWAEPLFIHTTKKDTGRGQTKQALAEDVDLVCALGGDGTVRAVGEVLTGTHTPMGLLPGGTGNLLARNLALPIDSIANALEVALNGQNQRIDVGRLTLDASGEHERPEKHVFLVMAGLGFDAAVMAGAPEKLKAKMGWPAYMVSGMRNLRGTQFRARVGIDDEPEFSRRTRTIVIGNCGRLTGGIVLMPDATVTDGKLDAILISPKGIVSWGAVAAQILTQKRKGHERVDRHTGTEVRVRADRPEEVQIDGDTVGKARAIIAEVQPLALIVRVDA